MHMRSVRKAGFSRPKILALRDLAAKAIDGTVPTNRMIDQWTVEMLLIFQLGRPDVLPVDDFGLRNGFRIAYRRLRVLLPKQVLQYGERWRPYRTAAAWYLWRAADREKLGQK